MAAQPTVSIVICTHNRAAALRQTLTHMADLTIRPEWNAELLIVDNSSTDDTAAAIRGFCLENLHLRYCREPLPGKSNALNTGLASTRGEVLLFTDDDVAPARDWVEQTATPLLEDRYDAVSGQLILGSHLERVWQTPMHLWWIGQYLEYAYEWGLIGANMGFKRSVLRRVPCFDTELGPGPSSLGFCEDTFFGMQLRQAGFRIGFLPRSIVIHHADAARLRRSAWLTSARGRGQSLAYIHHHWEHRRIPLPLLQMLWLRAKLLLRRLLQPPLPLEAEGCAAWEMSYVMQMEHRSRFHRERRCAHKYAPRGLTKLPAGREAADALPSRV
jgi:GT2 family glycosyltransferase